LLAPDLFIVDDFERQLNAQHSAATSTNSSSNGTGARRQS
jgi:hypothetical protein